MFTNARYIGTIRPASPGFGEQLRRWRFKRNLSQLRLAELVDCEISYISRLETGSRTSPSGEMAINLADALALIGAERVRFLSAAGVIEIQLTELQAALIAAWQDTDLPVTETYAVAD